eukprot:scaffold27575_cov69-Phaeocystis_antarctica.AAC.1
MYVDLAVAEMRSRDSRPTTRTSPLERQRTILTEGDRILRIITERVSSRSLFLPSARGFRATKTPKLPKHDLGNSPERPWARTLSCSVRTSVYQLTKPGSTRFKERTAAFPKHPPGVEAIGNAGSDEAGCTVEPVKPRRDAATEQITPVLRQKTIGCTQIAST